MSTTDPIADFFTRVRNAAKAKHKRVDVPSSNTKKAIAQILLEEKFISGFTLLDDGKQGILRIQLKYQSGRSVIAGLRRVSRPGLRTYRPADELPRVLGGLGVAIVSTSRGLMTDHRARKEHVGGEIMAYIW
jgi:small subunit ribosomal protein S8